MMDASGVKDETGGRVDHAPGDWPRWLADVKASIIFLTRLPLALPAADFPPLAAAARAFGLAGGLIGAAAAALFYALAGAGVPGAVAVAVMLAAMTILTGGLHEDGLADTADGFGGGCDPERRLAIMRDSRIGSYGVLALVLAFAIRWTALAALAAGGGSDWRLGGAVIAVAALSRAGMVVVLHELPPARAEGRSVEAGRPGRSTLVQALAAGIAIFIFALWPLASLAAMAGMALAGLAGVVALVGLARRLIGGQTGDVCGSAQVVAELAMLVAASTLIG